MTGWELLGLMLVIGLLMLFLVAGPWPFTEAWRQIIGDRVSYWLDRDGRLWANGRSLFMEQSRAEAGVVGNVVEINQGLFRPRNTIHGPGWNHWRIGKVLRTYDSQIFVDLRDPFGLQIKSVLEVTRRYRGLHEMFEHIEELEKQLAQAEDRRREWISAIVAVLRLIEDDRQFYRSKSSERIRHFLEAVYRAARDHREPEPDPVKIASWKGALPLLAGPSRPRPQTTSFTGQVSR